MTLAGWAERTSHVRLGCLVSGVAYRDPPLLVRMATALDHASGGRAVLGLGAGWHATEHATFGYDYPSLRQRLDRLEEAATIVARCSTARRRTSRAWFVARGARNEPAPLQARLPFSSAAAASGGPFRSSPAALTSGTVRATRHVRSQVRRPRRALPGRGSRPSSIERTVGLPPPSSARPDRGREAAGRPPRASRPERGRCDGGRRRVAVRRVGPRRRDDVGSLRRGGGVRSHLRLAVARGRGHPHRALSPVREALETFSARRVGVTIRSFAYERPLAILRGRQRAVERVGHDRTEHPSNHVVAREKPLFRLVVPWADPCRSWCSSCSASRRRLRDRHVERGRAIVGCSVAGLERRPIR